MGDLSEHFSRSEFACHDGCGKMIVNPRLIEALEQLRTQAGDHPIQIISGCRCNAQNAKVRGATHSEHIRGEAADIRIVNVSLDKALEAALKVPVFSGLGIYPNLSEDFLHVDVRPGRQARWAHLDGQYVAFADGLQFLAERTEPDKMV